MPLCEFTTTDTAGVLVCMRCGQQHRTASQPHKVKRSCRNTSDPVAQPEPCGGCEKAKPPGLLGKVKSLAAAVAAFVREPGFVPKHEYAARLEVCAGCDQYDKSEGVCLTCGCYVAIKAKGAAWHCPLSRWPNEVEVAQ